MEITAPSRPPRAIALGEWLFLGLLVGALLALNVPAQWTGIATDPEFTAWVAPLSNRLDDGLRLYDFGGHMPLPPLPAVSLYWLSGGHATWMTESIWTQVLVMLSALLLFGCLGRVLPSKIALLGAVAALATFSGSNVVLFYNALANFLVTCLACVAARYARDAAGRRGWLLVAVMGFLGAASLLAKQNIGSLAIIGGVLLIWALPVVPFKTRLRHFFLFGIFSVLSFSLLCLLMAPWISFPGMIQDVFLAGSECKGGTLEIILKLVNYLCGIGGLLFLAGFIVLILRGTRLFAGFSAAKNSPDTVGREFSPSFFWVLGVSFAGLVAAVVFSRLQLDLLPPLFATQEIGLVLGVLAVGVVIGLNWPKYLPLLPLSIGPAFTLGVLTLILLPAAAGSSLSAPIGQRDFYWYLHAIPFQQVALTAAIWLVFAGAERLPPKIARGVVTLFAVVFIAQNWQPWRAHWLEIKNCTDPWAGVSWYAGVRVTVHAAPLEDLVTQVRAWTRPDDAVLLLPDDPNFEECFERPRPALNCAIIFTDQYWLRYAADDFDRLQRNPPKVIIIGPRDHWRDYSRLRNNTGAVEALIDRIQAELLPARYTLAEAHKISYRDGTDYLDVWVRKN